MTNLNTTLQADEMNEDEMIYTVGDSLAYQFYCGNFSSSADRMIKDNISVNEFLEWLEDKAEEYDYEDKLNSFYGGHFSNGFWVELGRAVKF